jgi:hypothetical protein
VLQHFLVFSAPGLLDYVETVLFKLPPVIQGEGRYYCDLVSSFPLCGVVLCELGGQVRAEDPVLSDRLVFADNYPICWVEGLERDPVSRNCRPVWDGPIKNRRLLRFGGQAGYHPLSHPPGLLQSKIPDLSCEQVFGSILGATVALCNHVNKFELRISNGGDFGVSTRQCPIDCHMSLGYGCLRSYVQHGDDELRRHPAR